jgi:hypothetical protein
MKFKILIAALFVLVPVLFWAGDVMNDRKHQIIIEKATSLYKTSEEAAYSGTPFELLKKHEKLEVKRISYGKDFMAVKVEKLNGVEGWVLVGNGVKVYEPENA